MVKFIIGWLIVFVIRLIPFRPANVEPLMATVMPLSKKYGWLGGFVFSFLSIAIFDVFVGQIGSWTWITATVYGLVGAGAYFFFRNRKSSALRYAVYAVIGTLFFDAITGVAMGPLLYDQPFMEALLGQIPFTARHLLGSVISSLILSKAIERYFMANPRLETRAVFAILRGQEQV